MKLPFKRTLPVIGSLFLAATLFASPRPKHVVVISIDQANPDAIQKTEMPVVHSMVKNGAHTWNAFTIVPSITLPSHASMVSGVGIQAHQIDWNNYQPDKGPIAVPTIFSLAKERGLVTAMYVGKEKLKQLDIPGTVDSFVWPQPDDTALEVAKAFAAEFAELKPNVTLVHFADPDVMGHRHGIHSPEKTAALEESDAAIGIIQNAIEEAGLADESVIIISSDHGSHDVKRKDGSIRGTHGTSKPDDVIIPWIASGKGVKENYTITAPVLQVDTAATVLWLLDIPLPESFWGRPVTSAFESVNKTRKTSLRLRR